jgi:hypothetical protein
MGGRSTQGNDNGCALAVTGRKFGYLRAEPALECGSGAAAFAFEACTPAGKAVAALPHSKARTEGPRR